MKTIHHFGVAIVLATVSAGCAAALPPQDLVTARATYGTASQGPAATLDPGDLHSAQESLALAEQSFTDHGDTQGTRDLAYVADRKAQIAQARGDAMQSNQQQQQTLGQMHDAETRQLAATSGQLGKANITVALQGQALQNQNQALAVEQQRRQEADTRAAKAAADLAAFASVKQDAQRGMVITLSGSVLFVTNKSDLLPGAKAKLDEVADALTKQDTESKMVVEGHTDSQGAASYNQDLSQRRAQSVRDYLVSRGISPDRITSQGFGPTRPIADNGTAEGRANNRRVEIVVQPVASKS
jgi:outer membrane protein OmpA-like peptidoglycan-associated protein